MPPRSVIQVWLRPQDSFLARDGVAHDGEVATRCGLPAIPVCAETIALATMLSLAARNRCEIAHLPFVECGGCGNDTYSPAAGT